MATANNAHPYERKDGNQPQTGRAEPSHQSTQVAAVPPNSKLRIPDLSEMLQISASMVYKMVERDEIPYYRIGTAIRFDRAEIREWLKQYHRPSKTASTQIEAGSAAVESTEPLA